MLGYSTINYIPQILKMLVILQAFRFMVDSDHCPMISKYGTSLSKAVGPVDPSFLVVIKSHFNIKYSSYSESTNSTKEKVHVGILHSKICIKQTLKLEDLKVLRRSPDLFINVKIGQGQLQLIMKHFFLQYGGVSHFGQVT